MYEYTFKLKDGEYDKGMYHPKKYSYKEQPKYSSIIDTYKLPIKHFA